MKASVCRQLGEVREDMRVRTLQRLNVITIEAPAKRRYHDLRKVGLRFE